MSSKNPTTLELAKKRLEWAMDRHANKTIQLAAIRDVVQRMREHCEKLQAEVDRLEKENSLTD